MKTPDMKYLLWCLPFLAAWGCDRAPQKASLEAFFFPYDSLLQGKVYVYEPVGNPHDPPMFWHYQSALENGRRILKSTSYDIDFLPDQFSVERYVRNGVVLDSFVTWESVGDSSKQAIAVTIEAGNVFSFERKPDVLLTTLHWYSPSTDAHITFVRNRQYLSDTIYVFEKDTLAAARFYIRELIDTETEGHLELEYDGEECYARGIGLVWFRKNINPEWQMEYRLSRIYEPSYFEQLFGVRLKE